MRSIDVRLPSGRVAFSTRQDGVSEGPFESLNLGVLTDDDRARVVENRPLLLCDLGVEQFAMGHQVHGTAIREWDTPSSQPLEKVDGHLTRRPGLGLVVLV